MFFRLNNCYDFLARPDKGVHMVETARNNNWRAEFDFFTCQDEAPQIHSQPVGNSAFPRRWCNDKVLENFKCPNIPPNPFSRAAGPPQSRSWNSKYLKDHIFWIQYILAAVVTDYVKLLTRGSEIMFAWTYTETFLLRWSSSILSLTAS